MDQFEGKMKGVFSTCIKPDTIDESPMAYKPAESIMKEIADTVEITKVLKPICNLKDDTKSNYGKKKRK